MYFVYALILIILRADLMRGMKKLLFVITILIIGISVYAGPRYLFFDTETTGLPIDYDAPSSDTANWPRLVQLSWILTDDKGNDISRGDYIIYPKGFTIPVGASNIHRITTERALAEGVALDSAMSLFINALDSAEYIVGHNIAFDIKVVGAEMVRLGKDDMLRTKKAFCTMIVGTEFCKLPGNYGNYKWPKLKELYNKLFGCDFEEAHNSAADIEATKKCFWEMRRRKII